MRGNYFFKDEQYVLNRCAKYLARSVIDHRHTYSTDGVVRPVDDIAEAWRFPIIDAYAGGADAVKDAGDYDDYNEVTFIYAASGTTPSPINVEIVGTFNSLQERVALQRVSQQGEPSRYWSATFVVPKGQRHLYCFFVDGVPINDPINPQETLLDNGRSWSRFFTDTFSEPLVLERWELGLLNRLTTTIAPFHTSDAQNFLQRYYYSLDRQAKLDQFSDAYRLDDSVGEVNFIDNLLAREERHRLLDYKICLGLIDEVLRQRNPFTEPAKMSSELFNELYDQMAADNVPGWDTSRYGSPRFFLYLLRRHVATGCFSHPKYGGNTNGAGWAYLGEKYSIPPAAPGQNPTTLFNWRRAIEKPLGTNNDYRG